MNDPARPRARTEPALEHLARALAHRPPRRLPIPFAVRAAVAAIVSPTPDGLALLLVRRATRPGDPWSGDVALPGGREDAADPDLLATAIRETREELGLDLVARAHLLGRLGDVVTLAPRRMRPMIVSPWVFGVESDLAYSLVQSHPSGEIAASFFVTFAALSDSRAVATRPFTRLGLPAPSIRLPGRPEHLWGLTHVMVRELLRRAAEPG